MGFVDLTRGGEPWFERRVVEFLGTSVRVEDRQKRL